MTATTTTTAATTRRATLRETLARLWGRVRLPLLAAPLGGVLGSNYRDIFAFLVLIGVLVLRPAGLMGQQVSERA